METMKRVASARVFFLGGAIVTAVFSLIPVAAQTPLTSAVAERLPVRRVVLYKGGVGYFEHLGRVRGNQDVTIEFTSAQLDDVLKSMTALDLDGGRVASVNYNSDAGVDRRLKALRLSLGPSATRSQLLTALRGARVETKSRTGQVTGRLLSVEQEQRHSDGGTTLVDAISLVTEAGDIRTIALEPGVTVRILETDLNEEVGRYLSIVSSSREQDVRRLTISTTGQGDRDLFVSYVSEVPVWKSTYRLVLGAEVGGAKPASPVLQGWAIVDNTIGEDWRNVELSLVAGAPQAFIQRISQPYYVQRPVVPLPERVLLTPQTHEGALTTAGTGSIAGVVTDHAGGALPGVTIRISREGTVVGTTVTEQSGSYRLTGLPPASYTITVALTGFKSLVVNGVRVFAGSESSMNHTLEVGAMSEELTVSAAAPVVNTDSFDAINVTRRVLEGGSRSGGTITDRVQAARVALEARATGEELGDLFEYRLKEPITILKNQSALVPIVNGPVGAEKVSIWNAESSGTRPLRAVWITNSTGQTLDAGSVSIVEGQAFAGEGLMGSLKAGERRLLSYAQDLAMTVTAAGIPTPSRLTRVQLRRGVLIQQREERLQRTYTARNNDQQTRTLVLEHPFRAGWTLGGDQKPVESTPAVHRYRITVAPGATSTFTVDESRTTDTRIVIAALTDKQVELWITGGLLDEATTASVREVLRRKAVIADLSGQIGLRESELATIGRDQERVRENMKSLKGTIEERQLVQRYVRQLDAQETRLDVLRAEITNLTRQRNGAQEELNRFIETLGG
jgi:hypothetical protein